MFRDNKSLDEQLRAEKRHVKQLQENEKTLLNKLTKYETELASLQRSLGTADSDKEDSSRGSVASKRSARSIMDGRDRGMDRSRLQTIT
jgi:chromosome segregation ATPase